jgi:hypothetical protein
MGNMNILKILVIVLGLSTWLWAEDKMQPPVQVTKVEPDYGSLQTGYVMDVAEIELTLDAKGVPYALKSSVGLPDNVVQAIRQWRYEPLKKNGHATPSMLKMTYGFRRAITPALERSIRPMWVSNDEKIRQAVERGKQLTADEAATLEQSLPDAEALEHSRTSLLIYYSKGLPDAAKAREARARLIPWLIEHYPDDPILGSPAAIINASGEPLADMEAQKKAKELWAAAVAGAPHNMAVAEHALNFLQVADPAKAVSILNGMRTWRECYAWLGTVYAYQALGVKALDQQSGEPVAASDAESSRSVREALQKATDGNAVLAAMAAIESAHFSLARASSWTPAMQEFCGQFLAHTKEIYPATRSSCEVPEHDPNLDFVRKVSRDRNMVEAHLRKKVQPVYSQEARDKRVQGTLRFVAVIDENGRIQELGLAEGPLALYGTSRAAIEQWEFEPQKLQGRPVAVVTTIEVNFSLKVR